RSCSHRRGRRPPPGQLTPDRRLEDAVGLEVVDVHAAHPLDAQPVTVPAHHSATPTATDQRLEGLERVAEAGALFDLDDVTVRPKAENDPRMHIHSLQRFGYSFYTAATSNHRLNSPAVVDRPLSLPCPPVGGGGAVTPSQRSPRVCRSVWAGGTRLC